MTWQRVVGKLVDMATNKRERSFPPQRMGGRLSILYRSNQMWNQEKMAPLGLMAGSYPFLLHLHQEPGQTQEELTRSVLIDKAVTARTVKRLEGDGLLRRDPDPEDRRALRLSLTPSGEALIPEIRKILDARQEIVFKGFSDTERASLMAFLDRMVSNAVTE